MKFAANESSCKGQLTGILAGVLHWRAYLVLTCVSLFLLIPTIHAQGPNSVSPSSNSASAPQPPPSSANVPAGPNGGTIQQTPPTQQQPQQQPGEQAPANGQDNVFVFKKEVQEVMLHATVVDEQRRLVTSLDRSAFTVFEDGVPQTTTSFRKEGVAVAIGILIDNSGSMREKRDKINQAVLNLIRAGNSNDETFIVNFSQDSYLDQDFTSDLNLLQQALQKISARGETALYDAIVASAVHLKNNTRVDRKVLLVITDGRDNASQETLQEASRRLQQENGPTLYAIGLLGEGLQREDSQALQSLADATGGVAFFPTRLDEVDNITRTIARDIRSQYTIGYKSSNPQQNGNYRRIQVRAQAPTYRQLTVRTRSGYYPGESIR